jgi:hypothetical protein
MFAAPLKASRQKIETATAAPGRARRPGTPCIQAKLTVGRVDDPLEHEADRAAERVMGNSRTGHFRLGAAAAQPQLRLRFDLPQLRGERGQSCGLGGRREGAPCFRAAARRGDARLLRASLRA